MKYALLLNDMRQPNIENIEVVKVADTKKELIKFYNEFLVEPYSDEGVPHNWGKTFKKGSELEWFNGVHDLNKLNDYWGGIWKVNDDVGVGSRLYKGF